MSEIQKNPYVGPRTFQSDEGHLFFGREREARDLIALVASEQLVLFYAQSGAGKSSIVNTRLISNLKKKDYEVLPVGRVSGDVPEGKVDNIFVYNLIRGVVQQKADPAILSKLTLAQFLAGLNIDDNGYFYDSSLPEELQEPVGEGTTVMRRALIIDQFEELLSTHPEAWEKRDDFFIQLAQAMQEDPYLWVVLVMREDYIAALDPYAHHLPGGLRVRYYMQRLGREAALAAVKSPVEAIRPYAAGVAEKLVDDLCSIKVQKPDGTPDVQPGQYVEPVQLQVVCYGLWHNLSPEGNQITEKDLQEVGDVNQSLGKHYEGRVREVAAAKNVKERLIREWFERKLITAGGIRNMVLQEPNKKSGGLDDDVIQALQSDLVRAEKRGGATWYELTHDRLVEPILERNRIWFNENLSPLQRQAALWEDQDHNESWLLRDRALAEVEAWAKEHQDELTDTEKEFLETCRKLQAQIEERHAAERRQLEMANKLAREEARSAKRARVFNIVSVVLIVIAIIATFFSVRAARIADDEAAKAREAEKVAQDQSDIARSSELSTIALERANSQLDLALLLGVEADSFNSDSQTRKALLTLLQKSSRYRGSLKTEDDIEEIQYTSDRSMFVSRDKKGITFWDASTPGALNQTPLNESVNGHFQGVTALAMSQDGSLIVSGATNGTIVIWDAATRSTLSQPFEGNTGPVSSLALSPDGEILASANLNGSGSIVLWNIANPAKPVQIAQLAEENGSSGDVFSLAFDRDGQILAAGHGNGSITLWDVENHTLIGEGPLEGHRELVMSVAFSRDGNTLVSGSWDDTVILWDLSNPENPEWEQLEGHPVDVEAVAISPDGQLVASGDDLGNIILWDTQTGESISKEPLNGKTSWVVSLAFSPDSKTLAAGSVDQSLILWDVTKRAQIGQTLKDHRASVRGVAFTPDGGRLVSASEDSTLLFWDVSEGKSPQRDGAPLQGHPGQPTGMSFSPDGNLLASHGDDGTILLDVETQEQVGIGDILTSPDGSIWLYQTLEKTTREQAIQLMNAETNEPMGKPIPGQSPAFSPDSRTLVYRTTDPTAGQTFINLWDIAQARNVAEGLEGAFLNFSPDSQTLAYQTTDQDTGQTLINLWDIAGARNIVQDLEGSYLAVNPGGQTLVYQTFNSETGAVLINLWDIANAAKLMTIECNDYRVSRDGKVLAVSTADPQGGNPRIDLFDTATGAPRAVLDTEGEPLVGPVEGNLFYSSANNEVLLYFSQDGRGQSINALHVSTGKILISSPTSEPRNTMESGSILAYEIFDYEHPKPSIVLVNTTTGEVGGPIEGSGLNLTADQKYLIFGSAEGSTPPFVDASMPAVAEGRTATFNVWDIDQNTLIAGQLEGTYEGMFKDNQILIYQSVEGGVNRVHLFDVPERVELGEPVNGSFVGISADGATLVIENENSALVFWDLTQTWPLGDPVTQTTDKVSSAALSPDGKTMAYADASGITLQDTAADQIIRSFPSPHIGTVGSVSLSQDKDTLLTFGEDGKTIIWDLNTFQPLSDPINATYAFFSPNDRYVAAVDTNEKSVIVWDLTRQQAVAESFPGQNVIFSPDERYVAIGDEQENATLLWDLTNRQVASEPLTGQPATFSPDSQTLAVTSFDQDASSATTTLFDLTARQVTGEPIQGSIRTSPEADTSFVIVDETRNTTTFWDWKTRQPIASPIDGSQTYFTGTKIDVLVVNDPENNTTSLWNAVTRTQIGRVLAGIDSPGFSPDGTLMSMTDSDSNTTTIWDLEMQTQIGAVSGYRYPTLCADSNSKTAAWFDPNTLTVFLWDVEKDESLGELELGEESAAYGIALIFDSGCKTAAIGDYSQNKTILWDLAEKSSVGESIDGSPAIFSPDGSTLAVVDYNDNAATFWNAANGAQVGKKVEGGDISINPENSSIAAINNYNSSSHTIWDLNSGRQIGSEQKGFYYPAFASDDSLILYGNNGVNFWDVENNKMTGQPLPGHSAPIKSLLFSPVGARLASLASDGIVLTDLATGSGIHLEAEEYSGQLTTNMAFSPDGKSLTALGADGTILRWDIASDPPALRDTLKTRYKDLVNSVVYRPTLSPGGEYLIYELDSELNIWHIDGDRLVGDPTPIKTCCAGVITFTPDGSSMFYNDGGIIYQLDQWTDPDKSTREELSFGQNTFSGLHMIMDPARPLVPRYLISSSSDQGNAVTQIWDWERNSRVGDPISGNYQVLGSSAESRVLIYLDSDGRLIKFDLNPAAWRDLLCQRAGRNLSLDEWTQYIPKVDYHATCPQWPLESEITGTTPP